MERCTIRRGIYCFVSFVIFLSSVIARKTPGDCPTVDVRNTPDTVNLLKNCKVIKGNLLFVLVKNNVTWESYDNYTFPELREITGYLLIYDDPVITSFDKLFPNLTVIRGRRLFLNYALSIYTMRDLQTIGLKSLIAIQRGYVFIHRNPKLCYLEKINWDRLVKSPGHNHVVSDANGECNDTCTGCDYCWSNSDCQKFENDNLGDLHLRHRLTNYTNLVYKSETNVTCHPQCLGGCHGPTAKHCVVCRELSNHGTCVDKCSPDMVVSKDHARCYTKEECNKMGYFIYKDECVEFCPAGYNYVRNETIQDNEIKECFLCKKNCSTCVANPIYTLAASEHYRDCRIVNGSLIIRILEQVSTTELDHNLSEIREINGALKVYETTSLTNMSMFRHLTKIRGDPMDRKNFGLIIFGNKNLKKLWDWNKMKTLDLNGAAILIHSNYKLCNSEIKKLLQATSTSMQTRELDEIQYNEEEVGCDPITLEAKAIVDSHDTATLAWKVNETADDVRIFYTEVDHKNITLDMEDHCKRALWSSEFLRKDELEGNSTHFNYTITSLKQNTKYAYFIKSFNEGLDTFAQSKIAIFQTLADYPMSPIVYTQNKSMNSIELAWFRAPDEDFENQLVTFYMVDIFVHPDNQEMLDQRNYCTNPIKPIDMSAELLDYDNCCHVLEFEREELEFTSFVDQKFRCTLDEPCDVVYYNTRQRRSSTDKDIPEAHRSEHYVRSIRISGDNNSAVIDSLDYFTFYIFQFFACNEQGCGPYYLHSDRTGPNNEADKIEDVRVSLTPSGSMYEFHVHITPPKRPNGAVLLYNIYFRRDSVPNYIGDVKCLPRSHFANISYHFRKVYQLSDYKISVRVQSLAGPGKATEWLEVHLHESSLSWDWSLVIFLALLTVLFGILAWITRRYKFRDALEWLRQIRQRAIPLPVGDEDDEEILMERMHEPEFERDPDDTRGIDDEHFL